MKKILALFILGFFIFTLKNTTVYADPGYIEPTAEPTNTEIYTGTEDIFSDSLAPQYTYFPNVVSVLSDEVQAAAVSVMMLGPTFDRTRIPIELQDWWMPSYGHTHMACPMPIGLTVSGIVVMNCRIVMHDNPGKLHRISITDEGATNLVYILPGDLQCKQAVCAWAFDLKMDTTKVKNGWRELRFKTYVNTPDGKQMINSSGVPVRVQNGSSAGSNFSAPCNGTQLIGRGWYTTIEYVNSIFDCIPVAPVKGIFTIRARVQAGKSARLLIELDKSHFIPAVGLWPQADDTAGTVIFDKAGNFQSFQTITIDTRNLPNGWHSLSAKSFSAISGDTVGVKNTEVGVAKFWFQVMN